MKTICDRLDRRDPSEEIKSILGRKKVSPHARKFAAAFVQLQGARHLADYDPQKRFSNDDAMGYVQTAEAEMAAFDQIERGEQLAIFTLMLVQSRR